MASSTSETGWKQCIVPLEISSQSSIRLAYIDCHPPPCIEQKGTIVLLHGFPQTSYQFRHVISPLADAGYRIIACDYRGAGTSSKPASGFTKSTMASDIKKLLEHLAISKPIHLVGHDIGGMIAYAFASRYPELLSSVIWGECPLPGTSAYEADRTTNAVQQFHFIFHSVLDLPEALVAGRERIYLNHFFSKIAYNSNAISSDDLDYYTGMYSQPGAMRCGFEIYRAFEEDAEENRRWLKENGKCKVPTMALSGEMSRHKDEAEAMFGEVHEKGSYELVVVEDSGHYIAEENPRGFVREVLRFVERHSYS
jgi:pimeloyl-ACP methyl ester carboxylesterase